MLDDARFLMAGGIFECLEPASGQHLLAFTPLRPFAEERLDGAFVFANVPGYEPAQQTTDAPRLIGGCLSVDLELKPLVPQWEPVHIQFLGLRHDWLDTSEEGHGRLFQVLREGAERQEASLSFQLLVGTDVVTLPNIPYVPGEGIALSQFFGSTRFPSDGWIELSRETLRTDGHHVVVDLSGCAALELRPTRKDGTPYTGRLLCSLRPKNGPKSGPTVSMKGPVCKVYPLAPGAYTLEVSQPHVPESVSFELKAGERKVVLIEVGGE